jgi:ABC-type multidrug transport system fused ATPase/permease subunit
MNNSNKISKGKFKFIIDFLKENQVIFYSSLFLGIILSCCTLFIPLFIGKYYQILNNSNSSRGEIFDALIQGVDTLEIFLLYFISLIFFRLIIQFLQNFSIVVLTERCSKYLRQKLFESQVNSSFVEFEKKPVGNYLMRYSGDMNAISQFVNKGILGFLNDLVFITLTYFIFLQMNGYLTQVIFLILCIFFIMFYVLNRMLKTFTKSYRDRKSQNLGFVNERLSALFTIKVLNREKAENEKYKKRSEKLYEIGIKYGSFKSFIESLLPFATYVLLAIVLFYAFQLKKSNQHINGSQLIILIMLIIHLMPVFKRILKVNQVWQTGLISYKRFLELCHVDEDKISFPPPKKSMSSCFIINQLSYSSSDGNAIISDFSMRLEQPGVYLLNGESGSGKSLLFKILMGIYQFDQGEIEFLGNEYTNTSYVMSKGSIGYFSNELDFIGKTLFEMLTPNRNEEHKEKVRKALNYFGLSHFSSKLFTSDFRTNDLSANERVLLALVRLSLTERKLLLLDNPFLNTTNESNQRIRQYLEGMRKEKIIVIIDKSQQNIIKYDKEFEM